MRSAFELQATDGDARAGVLHTAHGDVPTPANAITSASSVERGRWKLVSSASTRRKAKPGAMKSSVRPESGAPRASVSSVRVVVVPMASTRSACSMRRQASGATS